MSKLTLPNYNHKRITFANSTHCGARLNNNCIDAEFAKRWRDAGGLGFDLRRRQSGFHSVAPPHNTVIPKPASDIHFKRTSIPRRSEPVFNRRSDSFMRESMQHITVYAKRSLALESSTVPETMILMLLYKMSRIGITHYTFQFMQTKGTCYTLRYQSVPTIS